MNSQLCREKLEQNISTYKTVFCFLLYKIAARMATTTTATTPITTTTTTNVVFDMPASSPEIYYKRTKLFLHNAPQTTLKNHINL